MTRWLSYEAATTLAVLPPLELLAATDAHVYRQLRSRQDDSAPPELVREALKLQARQSFLNSWWELLNSRRGSHRTFGAILPSLSRWVDRSHGQLIFRTTQVFTGHGCFGQYLRRIGRVVMGICHQYDGSGDTAEHTLEWYPAWEMLRRDLRAVIGHDLSLPSVEGPP
ncbi:uncharacterized protein LOC143431790 [Xylocopa sonorina]|uniref:uncharacterized protein LOC143431790 n=1 Tax=Xylocopa sonorina TaxID=1818115 RepID=UPI00403AFA45